jgi:subtilisin family serine protease
MRLLSLAFSGFVTYAATHIEQSLENAKMWGNVRFSDKTGGVVIQDEYIVMFDRDIKSKFGAEFRKEHMAIHPDGAVGTEWDSNVVQGYVVKMDEEMAAKVAAMPGVQYVEEHGIAFALDCAPEIPMEQNVWGTIRINNRELITVGDYYEELGEGSDVNSYVIDTGIDRTHPAFQGRALFGQDYTGEGDSDLNGHGTHVAGTMIGWGFGVAQEGKTVAVSVLNRQGSGTFANVISGIIWAGEETQRSASKSGVSNLSLGGGFSQAVNDAIEDAWNNNCISVVAAGNSNTLACNSSPAAAYNSICVGSTTRTDARSSFSNYGCCVDIYAPGSDII